MDGGKSWVNGSSFVGNALGAIQLSGGANCEALGASLGGGTSPASTPTTSAPIPSSASTGEKESWWWTSSYSTTPALWRVVGEARGKPPACSHTVEDWAEYKATNNLEDPVAQWAMVDPPTAKTEKAAPKTERGPSP